MRSFLSRLAVCSWSLQPQSPAQLIERLDSVGLQAVQLDLDPFREQPAVWGEAEAVFGRAGIQVVSGMFRTVGEDYTSPETIRVTGGFVPDATWEENWRNLQITVRTAQRFGLKLVTTHAGFLPHDPQDPAFAKLVERVRKVARLLAAAGMTLGFETGQESGPALNSFLEHLGEPNVAVNFDPANMILYENGDPIPALRLVGPWVRGCHLKDAVATKVPGTWGQEVAVGTGQVDWPAFFRTLHEVGFAGHLCFEHESGDRRVEVIRAGRRFVEKLLGA
jgi:sugar phosphate isomerase/epimerase